MKKIGILIVIFGITFLSNAQSPVNGILNHTNSYFTIKAYNSSYDDGSHAKIFYDGNNKIINFWNSDNNTTYTNLKIGNLLSVGNVGIGTSNPSAKLHIQNGGQNLTFLNGINTSGYTLNIGVNDDGVNISNNSNIRGFNFQNNRGDLLKIAHTGNAALYGKFEAKEIKVTLTPTADFVFENNYKLPTLEFIENYITKKKHLPEIASANEMKKNGVNIGEFQIQLLQKIEELTLYTISQEKKIKELESLNKKLIELQTRLEKLESGK